MKGWPPKKNFMNRYLNSRTKLILSMTLGVCVEVMVRGTLKHAEERLNSQYKATTVLVARKYISPGKEVLPDLVEEKQIPVAFVEPTALSRLDELKDAQGKTFLKTRLGVLKGEQISRSRLMGESGFSSLAWTLPPEQMAMSLRLAPEQA